MRSVSENVVSELPEIAAISQKYRDIWETDSKYDTWDSITKLVDCCGLSSEEKFLLNCLSAFECCPVPFSFVTEMSSIITQASQKVHLAGTLHQNLTKHKLVKPYPLPVVLHPAIFRESSSEDHEPEYVYIPQLLAQCFWKNMETLDKVAVLNVIYFSVSQLHLPSKHIHGLFSLLVELLEQNYTLVSKECYKSVYSRLLSGL